MKNKKLIEKLVKSLNEISNDERILMNQYVVGYYRTDDDTLIGYHLSSLCQYTKDILEAKRYSGSDPYKQLTVISENLLSVLTSTIDSDGLASILYTIKLDYYEDLTIEDIYLKPIELSDGTPEQPLEYKLLE